MQIVIKLMYSCEDVLLLNMFDSFLFVPGMVFQKDSSVARRYGL